MYNGEDLTKDNLQFLDPINESRAYNGDNNHIITSSQNGEHKAFGKRGPMKKPIPSQ